VKDGVGLTECEVKGIALNGGLKTYTYDFKFLNEALAYALYHVVEEGAVRAMKSTKSTGLVSAAYGELGALYSGGNAGGERPAQFALSALYGYVSTIDGDGNTCGDCDNFLTYSRHNLLNG
jgi:hypothetical protein